jgi:predicted transcriptional regulator
MLRNRYFVEKTIQMDIQATKLELVQRLLNTQKEQVLQRVREVFQEEDIDFWDTLSADDKATIDDGIAQLDQGEYVSQEAVNEGIKQRFNF